MSNGDLGWITNFIWGIADDVLRDRVGTGVVGTGVRFTAGRLP